MTSEGGVLLQMRGAYIGSDLFDGVIISALRETSCLPAFWARVGRAYGMILFPTSPQDGKLKDSGAIDLGLFFDLKVAKIRLDCRIPSPRLQSRCCACMKWDDGWRRSSWNMERPLWWPLFPMRSPCF